MDGGQQRGAGERTSGGIYREETETGQEIMITTPDMNQQIVLILELKGPLISRPLSTG